MKNDTVLVEAFIQKYKIALKHNWTREQFAEYMGMVPDSIRRKLGKVRAFIGLDLQLLPLGDAPLTSEKINKFNAEYSTQLGKSDGIKKNGKRFVITSAQNATPIHTGFLNSIHTFCEHNNAELLVIPYRYRNQTSVWSNTNEGDEWWAKAVEPYLIHNETQLCDNLVVLGNMKIQPTAADPLIGLEAITGTSSSIVGHSKVQLKSVPTMNNNPKLLLSTGTITKPNYTDSKIGATAEFHHSLAAVVVEIDDDDTFHLRHIHAHGIVGSFYDLDKLYTPTSVTANHRVAALITGDTHVQFIDDMVEQVTYHNNDSIVRVLNPKVMVFHDLLDAYARNHHHRGNDIIAVGKHRYGRNNVQLELQETANFIDRVSQPDTQNIIVKSNHDEALDRYLREADAKNDYENAEFYYYMKYHQMKNLKMTKTGFSTIDPLQFWCTHPENGKGLRNIAGTYFLKRDESYKIKNIELGFHGDIGANGARGDTKSFSRLSNKMVTGHSHSPAIYNGCYTVGLSAEKNLEYKRGPSSWMHTHCIIYPDGKRTLLHIINGKWKT